MRAGQRFFRQWDEFLLDRQMGVIAPPVPSMARLRTSLLLGSRGRLRIEQIVGTVAASRLLRLATKKLVLKDPNLAPCLLQLLFKLLGAFYGPRMHALPIA